MLNYVFACWLLICFLSCSESKTTETELKVVPISNPIDICFLPGSDVKLGDKLNVVLNKRGYDTNLYVVEEFPYISAHDDPKGDRVYRSHFIHNGERIFEEMNFMDSILYGYSASCESTAPKARTSVFEYLTCDLVPKPVFLEGDTSIVFHLKEHTRELRFTQRGDSKGFEVVSYLKVQ